MHTRCLLNTAGALRPAGDAAGGVAGSAAGSAAGGAAKPVAPPKPLTELEKFDELMSKQQYEKAAQFAANSKKQELLLMSL